LDLGIDGFRVDAVPYLFVEEGTTCENLPSTHQFLKRMRRMIEMEYPDRILLAEACQLPKEVREYFGDGDEFHMGFHFPLMPRIFMSIKAEDSTSLKDILEETPEIPSNCQWVTFLRNHDELTLEMVTLEERKWMWEKYAPHPRMRINLGIRRRLAPLLDNDRRKIELAHSMLLTLIGSPILYYGDEIGMGDNIWLPDRNGVRTPMQWDELDSNSGFSSSSTIYTPMVTSVDYNPRRVNVQDAQEDPSSLYNILRHMISTRRSHHSFGGGALFWISNENKSVASWLRCYGLDTMLVVSNLASTYQEAKIQIPSNYLSCYNRQAIDVLTNSVFPLVGDTISVCLDPYQFLWLDLEADLNSSCFVG